MAVLTGSEISALFMLNSSKTKQLQNVGKYLYSSLNTGDLVDCCFVYLTKVFVLLLRRLHTSSVFEIFCTKLYAQLQSCSGLQRIKIASYTART